MKKSRTKPKPYCLQGHVPNSIRDAIYKSKKEGLQIGRIVRQLGHLWSRMPPETQRRLYFSMIDEADPEDKLVVELMKVVDAIIRDSLLDRLPETGKLIRKLGDSSKP